MEVRTFTLMEDVGRHLRPCHGEVFASRTFALY